MGQSIYKCPGCDGLVRQINGLGQHQYPETPCRYNYDFIGLNPMTPVFKPEEVA